MGGKLKHRTSSSREAAPAKPKLSCTCSQPPLPQTRLLACLLSCIESREGGPHCALCSSASDVTGGAPVSHMFKWLPKASERPLFSITPKGLPKTGAGTLAKVDGLWESAKQGLLGLGPWMGRRIQMPRAGKVPKKITASPSPARTARSALSAWQGSGLLKLAALKLGEAEEAALQLLR